MGARTRVKRQGFSLVPLLVVLSLWCPASAPPAAAQEASPTIELSSKSGPPTTPLVVSGAGFCPHGRVQVYLDAELASVLTGNRGRFSASVRVPASALPGEHWVVAVSRCSRKHALARFLVRTDWSQSHFDPQHSGSNPFENVLDPGNVSGLKPAWIAKNQGIFYFTSSSPAVVNGVVYVGTAQGRLDAFDAAKGTTIWSVGIPGDVICSSPAVQERTLYVISCSQGLHSHSALVEQGRGAGASYVGSERGALQALDADTGKPLWKAEIGNAHFSSPAVSKGVVYVGSEEGKLYAFNSVTGASLWGTPVGSYGYLSSPAVSDGLVYVGSREGKLHALDGVTGRQVWTAVTGDDGSVGSPAVADGIVYTASHSRGKLHAFNASTGAFLWSTGISTNEWSGYASDPPAVAKGMVYVGSGEGKVYAFNSASGALLWTAATGDDDRMSSPAVANGVVYVGSTKVSMRLSTSKVYAFNGATGDKLWNATLLSGDICCALTPITSSPVVANGVVYVGTEDFSFHAFSLAPEALRAGLPPSVTPDKTSAS